ncbi:MAG: hypothetical protein A2268_03525 [Candidatus Raymondbacteria bacterium RifOxyA12_full_50_37]|nr:MAG: hypothetical protein A2268_03525 [Candidatus Raymondbacteria bacterium RifOxyA12_full_50_37]OGJ88379.1 MAG: hypothetical protein A2248_00885 [Candidatus Raymondbacteria bacterium RIFOXYA2_FULL_49_16]OGJ96217.1 MAG: hypothetical protein A2453_08615 [Candidatus Raymondbacteria bacterium RIFOXYC2_FULL_50_21]OGP41344.1 MAG: hypothetical protein A2324_01485 [Candidatus Raymondbacteria bacterium RIFOXYB2_FULL_49_35]
MKYLSIYKKLRKDILGNIYPPSTQMPHLIQLAQILNCSPGTIKSAMRLLQQEGLVVGIRSKGTFVRDNAALLRAPEPRKNRLGVLVLTVFSSLAGSYYQNIFKGIEHVLKRANCHLYIIRAWNKTIQELYREIHALGITALITVEFDDRPLRREIERLRIPIVHADLFDVYSKRRMVLPNNIQGGELAVKKLFEKGHKRFLFLHAYYAYSQRSNRANIMRWKGAAEAARKLNSVCLWKKVVLRRNEEPVVSAGRIIEKYSNCKGIIVPDSDLLEAVRESLLEKAPTEAAAYDVVAFSLNERPMHIHQKPVWYCAWDTEYMGRQAAEMALGKAEEAPRVQYLPMYLTTRV